MTTDLYEFLYQGLSMKTVGVLLGLVLLITHGFALVRTPATQKALKAFPRNRPIGIVLTVVISLWAMLLMKEIDMGEFFALRSKIIFAIPILAGLVIVFVDEFLAVRSFGGLLLLLAAPILSSAWMNPEGTKILLPILAYVWVVAGLFLVGMPYLARDWIDRLTAKDGIWKAACAAGIFYGAALLVLALIRY